MSCHIMIYFSLEKGKYCIKVEVIIIFLRKIKKEAKLSWNILIRKNQVKKIDPN